MDNFPSSARLGRGLRQLSIRFQRLLLLLVLGAIATLIYHWGTPAVSQTPLPSLLEHNGNAIERLAQISPENRNRLAQIEAEETEADENVVETAPPSTNLLVLTKPLEPLVIENAGEYQGFAIELWQEIARRLNYNYRIEGVETVGELLENVENLAADIAIGGISITAERESRLDFSYPFLKSGLQILVPQGNGTAFNAIGNAVGSILLSPTLYVGLGIFILTLLIVAHIVWFAERGHNPDFPERYGIGIWEAFWWAAVTVTTVGYGDKTPKKPLGKLVGLIWMCAGYFVFGYFIATMTTIFAFDGLQGAIRGPEDLAGRRVATIERSTAAEFLDNTQAIKIEYELPEQMYEALLQDRVDAIVYDAPVLQYYSAHEGQGQTKVTGPIFQRQSYGFTFPKGSPYIEEIDIALLEVMEDGTYKALTQEWFGENSSDL